jgi:hypothetical protein
LLAIGVKDLVAGGFSLPFPGGWFVSARLEADRFYSQHRENFGDGSTVSAEAGRHFRFMSVGQTLSLLALQAHFSTDTEPLVFARDTRAIVPPGTAANSSFFMPTSFHQIGARWAFGEADFSVYGKSWLPFGGIGINYANTSGSGYDVAAGLRGPVLGRDQLKIFLAQGESGRNDGGTLRQAMLTYQYFY